MSDESWAGKQIHLKPIGWVKPYPDNPRMITEDNVAKLAAAIEQLGFNDPIQCREDGTILVGHRRLLAAKKLKLKLVPVIIHGGMSDEEAQAYRISHNRVAEDVEWNRASLADQLSSLPTISLDTLGFEAKELGHLFDLDRAFQDAEDAAEKQAMAELPGPFLRQGEAWHFGKIATISVWSDRPDSIRKVEGLISKMEKWLKVKATLGAEDGPTFAAVIAERSMSMGDEL